MQFWKVLRILVTDKCNYRCIYCHNEGQHASNLNTMKFEQMKKVVQALDGMGLKEIRFSGGEPFVNPQTIKMIEWAAQNTSYEIGCATNGQLLDEEIIKILAENKVKVTVHFAANTSEAYRYVTGGDFDKFISNVKLLEKYHVEHSFNFVLYPEIFNEFDGVLNEIIIRNTGLKLLPYIELGNMNVSSNIINKVRNRLDEIALSKERIDGEGIEVWRLKEGNKIKLLHSPCYSRNLSACKEYGEVRLLPNMSIQKCIMDNSEYKLNLNSCESIRKDFQELWNSFTQCSQNIINQ